MEKENQTYKTRKKKSRKFMNLRKLNQVFLQLQFRDVYKKVFVYLSDTSLNFAADFLTDKGGEPDERKLKKLTKEISEEKIEMLEQYLK